MSDRNFSAEFTPQNRRTFLGHSVNMLGLTGMLTAGGSSRLFAGEGTGEKSGTSGYGPLAPVKDETSGLELLMLPEGFRYLSYGWANEKMSDDRPTPRAHDGMAVIATEGDVVTLCRNHELSGDSSAFGDPELAYDAHAAGGCTNLQFNTKDGKWLKSWASISGTIRNCAGGVTPWGTWLTCEETVLGPKDMNRGRKSKHEETHGWIFEVAADGKQKAEPLKAMGRFIHEAIAVDAKTKVVYETEDRGSAGFYRFTPNEAGKLSKGGKLEMLAVKDQPNLSDGVKPGETFACSWVPIEDPTLAHTPNSNDSLGVYTQGKKQGGTTFARLEGCWFDAPSDICYFVSTSGGKARKGQIWAYAPRKEELHLVYESPKGSVLDMPDNMTVSPRGGLVLCEDGKQIPQRVHGLSPQGDLFELIRNNVILKAKGRTYDYTSREWAGPSFSPDGKWLFVNVQSPGITFAITGPWEAGIL